MVLNIGVGVRSDRGDGSDDDGSDDDGSDDVLPGNCYVGRFLLHRWRE